MKNVERTLDNKINEKVISERIFDKIYNESIETNDMMDKFYFYYNTSDNLIDACDEFDKYVKDKNCDHLITIP